MTVEDLPLVETGAQLRPLDLNRDLSVVADLIELCFASTMDPDGREYLRQMRRVALNPALLQLAPRAAEYAPLPLSGYVWEEEGEIVGNLSLIPLHKGHQRVYLIANVAVHPQYRRRGIARRLTRAALEHAHRRGATSAWLQVRDDNPAAEQLYLSLGFVERARRTTWQSTPGTPAAQIPNGIPVSFRRAEDWKKQTSWLSLAYPPDVAWNLPLNLNKFRPGLFNDLMHFFSGENIRHWAARPGGWLAGVLTWEMSRAFADNVWLAVDPQNEDTAIRSLLAYARRVIPKSRPLAVNYPAGRATLAFDAAGFSTHQTLIWMEAHLDVPPSGMPIPIHSPVQG